MKLSTKEISEVKSVLFPARWQLRHRTRVAEIARLIEPAITRSGSLSPLHPGFSEDREFIFKGTDDFESVISLGSPSRTALNYVRVVRCKSVSFPQAQLELGEEAEWQVHPERTEYNLNSLIQERDTIVASWSNGINFRSDKNGGDGLRTPQIGALHAIAAHWSISQKPGIVVMPTGTGKTEVMVATILAHQCRTVLVIVPSDALRSQTARKFQTLGVLRSIGVARDESLFPIVGTLRGIPKNNQDLEVFECCNVVVATMSSVAGASPEILDKIAAYCTHLFLDEAHHAPADTWNDLRERFSERTVLQFTATPFRRDGRRMEGLILYNYPLAKAQAEDYFRPIRFEQVWEWDEEEADAAIAEVALGRLREDMQNGFDHIMMARTDSIERAQALYEKIYSSHPDLYPVIIHNRTLGRRKILAAIKARKHRVIVCVDMLGEGFDLPQLKIAALHDAHRSLGVTLQFAGRFTRTSKGIGKATVVANLADRKISESLEELYSEDADWNYLLPGLSYDAIRPQLNLSTFIGGLQSSIPTGETEILSAATIQPKISTVVYRSDRFRPDAFRDALARNMEVVVSWKNMSEKVLVFIVRHPEDLGWARTKDVTHLIYDLFIVFFDSPKKLLFIHSSVKSTHLSLARAIGGNVTQLRGETMFRVLGGIERVLFYNAGLLSSSSGAVRFQMFAGLDVAKAIDPAQQQGTTKSNLFGAGYEDGRRVTIGCSQKGTVWSQQTSSIPEWMEWCRHIGSKLIDGSISTTAYLDHTLVPEAISTLPHIRPLCIEWPGYLFEHINSGFDLLKDSRCVSWLDCSLDVTAWTTDGFEFVVSFPDGNGVTFCAALSPNQPLTVTEVPMMSTNIRSTDMEQPLARFFEEHPPLLRFENGTELLGNILIKPRVEQMRHFSQESLIAHDWAGVEITRESKWKNGLLRNDSVQQFVINQLLSDPTFTIVIDDDDSGEAADVVAIRETSCRVEVHLFHCKFSDANNTGSRADDLYVVCGQAQKGVMWTINFNRLVDHIIHRQNKSLNGRPTRFERGSLKDLYRIQRAIRKALPEYFMTVVQPGVSKAAFKAEHSAILGATSLFLRQRLNTALKVWVSP